MNRPRPCGPARVWKCPAPKCDRHRRPEQAACRGPLVPAAHGAAPRAGGRLQGPRPRWPGQGDARGRAGVDGAGGVKQSWELEYPVRLVCRICDWTSVRRYREPRSFLRARAKNFFFLRARGRARAGEKCSFLRARAKNVLSYARGRKIFFLTRTRARARGRKMFFLTRARMFGAIRAHGGGVG